MPTTAIPSAYPSLWRLLTGAGLNGVGPSIAQKALDDADIDKDARAAKPTAEQLERGSNPKPGLRGKALAAWVISGESPSRAAAASSRAARASKTTATPVSGPRPGGALADALEVLKRHRGKPMTPQEIYDAGTAKGAFSGLKGKTPVATLQAQLATANKRGVHVERPEPGKYQIRKASK